MSQQQGRVTDNLASIIQRVQLEHRTGELHIKRFDGLNIEQGSIVFVDGRAVHAQLGSYQEAVAFDMLRTWKQCVFIFAVHSSSGYQLPAPSQTPPPQSSSTPNSGPLEGFSPAQTSPLNERLPSQTSPLNERLPSQTSPLNERLPSQMSPLNERLPTQTQPLDGISSLNIRTPLPSQIQPPPVQNSPRTRIGWTQSLEGLSPSTRNAPTMPESDKQRSIHPSTPSIPLAAVPRATMSVVKAIGLINQAGLPRTCRQVLLLIDGRHTVNEIISMANTSPEETMKALNALENLAIITLSKPG